MTRISIVGSWLLATGVVAVSIYGILTHFKNQKKESALAEHISKREAVKRYFVTKEEIWRLLSSAQPRRKITVPISSSSAKLPVFTNPTAAQRKARELGLWMFVYNMPGSQRDAFPNSSSFLKFLSRHCVLVIVDGFGSKSAECPWEYSGSWPCCRILDADGCLVSPIAKWGGYPEVSGQKMEEIFKGFMTACEIMPAAFDAVEQNPDETGLAKLHDALSALPESFVNVAYLKWAKLLVKVDCAGDRGWRTCYSYADKVLPLREEFGRHDDWEFDNDYYRAKDDKKKYHGFLSRIDRIVLERRISDLDDIRKRIKAIDEQCLSDEARRGLKSLVESVDVQCEELDNIQKDLLEFEKLRE